MKQVSSASVDVGGGENDVSVNNVNVKSQKVCLRILPVVVHGKDVEIETYALLDEGSQVTLCDEKLFERLNLPSIDTTLNLNTVNQTVTHDCKETSFVVSSLDGVNNVSVNRAFTVTELPVSLEGLPEAGMCKVYPHLNGVDVPRVECDSVQLLIGCNVPDVFRVLDERTGQDNEPIAKLSKLGWTALGPIGTADMEPVREFLHVCPAQVESEIDPVGRKQTTEFADLVVIDRQYVNVIDSVDSFRSLVDKLRDHDRCSKYVLLFVMLMLSCYFCAVNFQDNQEYCVSSEMCCVQETFKLEFISLLVLHHDDVLDRMVCFVKDVLTVIASESMMDDEGMQIFMFVLVFVFDVHKSRDALIRLVDVRYRERTSGGEAVFARDCMLLKVNESCVLS